MDLPQLSQICHPALLLLVQSADLQLAEDYLELVDPSAAQVQEVSAVPDPYHPLEHQELHQVALEAAMELDPPTSAPSVDLEVSDSAGTMACLEAPAPAPLMDISA